MLVDLIAHGLTCGKGYVDEPLLQANASPTIAMERYTSGFTMAESFYAASRFVGWEDIIVGDPQNSLLKRSTLGVTGPELLPVLVEARVLAECKVIGFLCL